LVHRPGSSFSHSEIAALAPTVDGIVCTLTDRIDAAILGAGRLRVVANVAAGYDNIDLGAAARHNVTVCNTPGVLDEATADTAFLLLLAATRRFTEAGSHLRSGEWTGWKLADRVGCELFGGTLGLVGFGRIGRAVLVNTARGPIVDEAALADALHQRLIFAAGLDVYEHEPLVHPRLLAAPNAVLLPHIGSATATSRLRMATLTCDGVVAVLAGARPKNAVSVTST
jgi:lactate dehydrogenase-like 2-hydroxyacid dehydrogenase